LNFSNNMELKLEETEQPLIVAILNYQHEILQLLLDSGMYDVNEPDEHGWTPLMWACWRRDVKALQILIKCPSLNINQVSNMGRTALHLICMSMSEWSVWSVDVIKLLLTVPNIDVNIKDIDGRTALGKSMRNDVRLLLVQHGAKE